MLPQAGSTEFFSLGAVGTTFVAGVEAIRKETAEPIGSLTQMGTIRLGKRTDNRVPKIKDFVQLLPAEIENRDNIFAEINYRSYRS